MQHELEFCAALRGGRFARMASGVALALSLSACEADPSLSDSADGGSSSRPHDGGRGGIDGSSSTDAPGGSTTPDPNGVAKGAAIYAQMCQVCHGDQGQGGQGPKLRDWSRGKDELVSIITARMPLGGSQRCQGVCADEVASFILANFVVPPPSCPTVFTSPRRLRLLTRREYRNTVADLLSPTTASGENCSPKTFSFDPTGRTLHTVHVAGSFNGWPATLAAGGWALQYDATAKKWSLPKTLQAGKYEYKFVLDETEWVTDPLSTGTTADGQGGQNSTLTCGGSAPVSGTDPTLGFPAESRPDGFPFDDHADARVVTAVQAQAYSDAALALAQGAPLSSLAPCASGTAPATCAESFVKAFGLRAFRRPLSAIEVARYKDVVVRGTDFPTGVATAVRAFLTSPSFLYRSELGDAQPDGTYLLSPYEVASALSYMFWGTMPDAALLDAAAANALATPAAIEAQARRLLADPRSRDTVAAFATQWLGVEPVLTVTKNGGMFPGFDDATKRAMFEETGRFFTYVTFDAPSRKFDDLLLANFTMANASLATAYGLAAPAGTDFQRVDYGGSGRSGILGHGSVLATYAHPDQTSPIRRGLFVRRSLLCQDLPPPPSNVPSVPAVDPKATTRERFRQHTSDPACANCHQNIDPVGFGFEKFDAVGHYRDVENGTPVDAQGDMTDVEGLGSGTHATFSTLPELAQVLAASASARSCFTRQYFRFARGYSDSADDLCALSAIGATFKTSGYDIQSLMVAVTQSADFRFRR